MALRARDQAGGEGQQVAHQVGSGHVRHPSLRLWHRRPVHAALTCGTLSAMDPAQRPHLRDHRRRLRRARAPRRRCARRRCSVTLVDRRNHHLFQPLLYQVATAACQPGDIAYPIRAVLRGQRNVAVLLAEVDARSTLGRAASCSTTARSPTTS